MAEYDDGRTAAELKAFGRALRFINVTQPCDPKPRLLGHWIFYDDGPDAA